MEKVKPYANQEGTKKEQVENMFNSIAPHYDRLNRLLSFGIDRLWRRNVVKLLAGSSSSPLILDVATGTADLALELCRLKPAGIQAVDISQEMLNIAYQKILKKRRQLTISLHKADSENLPFTKNSFDAVTVAFGVRNFENLEKGLCEMARVLRPGGRLIVLEFSRPRRTPFKQFYHFYFTRVLPWWGGWVSKNKDAYTYLPASVEAFPEGTAFEDQLKKAGLAPIKSLPQTFGVATIYLAEKRSRQ